MKKLSILLLSVVALGTTVTSCSKDEAAPSIVGKWEFNTMEGTEGSNPIQAGTKETYWSDSACTTTSYWEFDNGTGLHYGFYNPNSDCALTKIDAAYSIDAKNTTITVITSSGNINYPITKLTAKELSWREQGTGKDADGNAINVNIIHNMVRK